MKFSHEVCCVDCLYGLVNHDYDGLSNERMAEVKKSIKALGYSDCGERVNTFSFDECFCCHTQLGGERYRLYVPECATPDQPDRYVGGAARPGLPPMKYRSKGASHGNFKLKL